LGFSGFAIGELVDAARRLGHAARAVMKV